MLVHPNLYINVAKNSTIKIIDAYINFSKHSFVNKCVLLNLHACSTLWYHVLNHSNSPLLDVYSLYSFQKLNSKLFFYKNSFGNQFYKGMLNFFLHEKNTFLNIKSANLFTNNSTYELMCNINHYESKSKSCTLFRSVNRDKSKSTFYGNLNIGLDVKNIDAQLQCDALLLSENANVLFIPELNLENDNVKCAHGATIGELDQKILIYIMSRGISKEKCISILIMSFLSKATENNNIFSNILNKEIIKIYYIY